MIRYGIYNQLDAAARGCAATLTDMAVEHLPLLWASERFMVLTGRSARELVGRSVLSLYGRDAKSAQALRPAVHEGRPVSVEVTISQKGGAPLASRLLLDPIKDASGKPVFVLGVHDLGEGQPPREALLEVLHRHRQELLSAGLLTGHVTDRVLQSIFAGIVAVNRKGTILYANNAALAVLERAIEETIGRSIGEVLGEATLALVLEGERAEEHFDQTLVTAKAHRREVGLNLVRVNAVHDAEVHCVFVFRDIGDRRQYELELRRLKALSALGQMAAGFAHEVRNPLAAMRSLNDCLMLELDEADARREYPRRIAGLIGRIESLVEYSLHYARPRPPERTKVSLARIVHGALETLAPRLGSASHTAMPIEIPVDTAPVDVDEAQMVQVLVILLENALDSTGDPRRVGMTPVTTHLHGQAFVAVHVSDDGPGIDEPTMQRVFDPFYTTKPKGTGLGLAIAQRLMRDNAGHLLATSEPYKKTVFSMLMPVVRDEPGSAPGRTS